MAIFKGKLPTERTSEPYKIPRKCMTLKYPQGKSQNVPEMWYSCYCSEVSYLSRPESVGLVRLSSDQTKLGASDIIVFH